MRPKSGLKFPRSLYFLVAIVVIGHLLSIKTDVWVNFSKMLKLIDLRQGAPLIII